MILLAAAVVIIIVVIVGLALDLTLFRSSGVGALLVIGGGGLLVLAGGAVLLLLVGGGGGDEDSPAESKARTTETRSTTTTTTATTATTGTTAKGGSALDAREVAVHANPDDDFAPFPSVVDRLPSRAVLLVTATGFGPGVTGLIEQCTATGCGNPFPVTFGDDGAARLQYLVADEVQTGSSVGASCHPDDPPCIVRVSSGGTAAFVTTVFGGPARPAPTVTIDAPDGEFVDGRAVRVVVAGFVPGEHVQAMLCAAPASYGTTRCGAPSPVAPITVDANGRGRTALVIGRGRVGTDGVSCGRETKCGVAVSRAGSSVPGPVVVVTFAAGPSATYDSARLLSGLLIAGLLLLLACVLARTTDWRKPTEADTPELDRAVLVE